MKLLQLQMLIHSNKEPISEYQTKINIIDPEEEISDIILILLHPTCIKTPFHIRNGILLDPKILDAN